MGLWLPNCEQIQSNTAGEGRLPWGELITYLDSMAIASHNDFASWCSSHVFLWRVFQQNQHQGLIQFLKHGVRDQQGFIPFSLGKDSLQVGGVEAEEMAGRWVPTNLRSFS